MVPLNNCYICKKVFQKDDTTKKLCPDCLSLQEAQYKVTLTQIEQKYHLATTAEIIERLDFEPYRLNAYLNHRFVKSPNYPVLDGDFEEYCFICNDKIHHTKESTCIACLQKILAAIENRVPDLTKINNKTSSKKESLENSESNAIQLKLISEEFCVCAEDIL